MTGHVCHHLLYFRFEVDRRAGIQLLYAAVISFRYRFAAETRITGSYQTDKCCRAPTNGRITEEESENVRESEREREREREKGCCLVENQDKPVWSIYDGSASHPVPIRVQSTHRYSELDAKLMIHNPPFCRYMLSCIIS